MSEDITYTKICRQCRKKFTCHPNNRIHRPENSPGINCSIHIDGGECDCDVCFAKGWDNVSGKTFCRSVFVDQKPRLGKLIGGVPIQ